MSNSLQLIEQNDFAYSAQCQKTSHLQMSFGNVSLMMTPKEFSLLKKHVQDTLINIKDIRCPHCRDIFIKTSVTNMSFLFSYDELCHMHDIMVNTLTMLEVQSILDKKE
ncbi:hypothetical protein OKW21_001445 [Catalinimonas alkaloidigena]|uniref:DUF6686 family protein n=1 Tax=Catalinimonas alkaloidigena TaxID=1075417 RepID=UPI002404EC73|nr:DUF6686 family protein [Catalinimonas alkaloidigena]MDF9796182.1 hypothetical protein [Catalinimonas alkaloidigena]